MGQAQSTSAAPTCVSTYTPPPSSTSFGLTCPSIVPFTSTVTSSSYISVATSTKTGPPTTEYASTSTVTISDVATVTVDVGRTTGTSTYTPFVRTLITQTSARYTVSVPTSRGFTPLGCEPEYQGVSIPITTVYDTVTVPYDTTIQSTISKKATLTITESVATSVDIIESTYDVAFLSAVYPTKTITRPNPTTTIYEACGSLNVKNRGPSPPTIIEFAYNIGKAVSDRVWAIDETDCCAICQGTPRCFAGAFAQTQIPNCNLFLLEPNGTQSCDPRFVGANMIAGGLEAEVPPIYVFNSGCGQVDFAH